jgi:hypothetical protein
MLSSGSEDQLCSPAAVLLWSCFFFSVLGYWGFFLCLTPFLWGKVSDPLTSPLLSACCDGLLFVFEFCRAI